MSGHASSQHEGAISLVLCAGSSRSPGERRTERVELSTVYRELTAKSPTPHAHFPHVVHLRSCACWRLLLYARLLDALSRAFSWAWRLWRSAGWCCGLPVRAFRSLFGARVPVLRSGAGRRAGAPRPDASTPGGGGVSRTMAPGHWCRLSIVVAPVPDRYPQTRGAAYTHHI